MGAKPLKNILNIGTLGISGTINAQKQAAKDAANAQTKAIQDQTAQAALLAKQEAEQPKEIQSDDYAAKKLRTISGLRLGLASTINTTPSLSTTSGLKTKLG